jgi:hypothetical protein
MVLRDTRAGAGGGTPSNWKNVVRFVSPLLIFAKFY